MSWNLRQKSHCLNDMTRERAVEGTMSHKKGFGSDDVEIEKSIAPPRIGSQLMGKKELTLRKLVKY